MKKLFALMALAGMFAVGCKSDRGGTSDTNYNTSDTSTGKMQDNNANQPYQGSNTSTSKDSTTQPQQP
jgi:hypothetical protein